MRNFGFFCLDFSGLVVKNAFNVFKVTISDSKVFFKNNVCLCFLLIFERKRFDFLATTFSAWLSKMFSTCPRYRFEENETMRKINSFHNYFWSLWEELSDLWQNFYCMVFKTVFYMSRGNFLKIILSKKRFFKLLCTSSKTFSDFGEKNWTSLSKLRSMCPVKVLRNKDFWTKNSSSYNYFQLLIVKIADFGEIFTARFSSFFLEIQEIFLRKKVIEKTGNFMVLPVFEWESSAFRRDCSGMVVETAFYMYRGKDLRSFFSIKKLFCNLSRASSNNILDFGETPADCSELHDTFPVKSLKNAKLGKTALYVSRRTYWVKTNWREKLFSQHFLNFCWNFFVRVVEIKLHLFIGAFSGNLFRKGMVQ